MEAVVMLWVGVLVGVLGAVGVFRARESETEWRYRKAMRDLEAVIVAMQHRLREVNERANAERHAPTGAR